MISTDQHPWNPRVFWFLGPSLLGGLSFWLIVLAVLHGGVKWQVADLGAIIGFVALAMVTAALWLSPLLISPYLVSRRLVQAAICTVASLPILFFFPLTWWTGLAYAVCLCGLWWGLWQGQSEADNRLQIRPYHLLNRMAPLAMMVVMVVVSILYYQQLRASTSSPQQLAQRLVGQTVSIAERFLPLVYQTYQADMTVDQFLVSQVPDTSTILKSLNVNIPESVPDPTFTHAELDQARNELSQRLGLTLRGDESMHQALVEFVSKQYQPYINRYLNFIPSLLAVALFFLLRIFSIFFQWAIVAFGWLLYRLLRFVGVVRIDHLTVPAERLRWR